MLEFRNVQLTYNSKPIFSCLNFTVNSGEKILLKGPSGAGKTSIFDLIMGFSLPSNGEIIWKLSPYNIIPIQTVRADLAWVPQNLNIFPSMPTIEGIFSLYDNKINKSKSPKLETILALAKELNINSEQLHNNYLSLSGGESQRISILSAILLDRELTLMDEPTSALDKSTASKAMNLILKRTRALICITHSSEFDHLFDKIISLEGIDASK